MILNRTFKTFFLFSLSLCLFACGGSDNSPSNGSENPTNLVGKAPLPTLNDIDFIVFSYSLKEHNPDTPASFVTRSVAIESRNKIKKILDDIVIHKGERLKFSGMLPYGHVDFHKKNGEILSTFFVKKGQLDISQWGQLYVNESLYKAACKISSDAEGREIDVLKLND